MLKRKRRGVEGDEGGLLMWRSGGSAGMAVVGWVQGSCQAEPTREAFADGSGTARIGNRNGCAAETYT